MKRSGEVIPTLHASRFTLHRHASRFTNVLRQSRASRLVSLVGSGPGDPGLLTLRAKQRLEEAEIVFYDHLVNPEIFRFCPQARLVDVGKRGYREQFPQAEIAKRLIRAARRYRRVLRLKGGDPFIFGRGGEEAEALSRAGVPFEIVPGVTSAIAVPAYAGIPLTDRRFASSVSFVTGHSEARKGRETAPPLDWAALAKQPTLVFLMAVQTLAENCKKLMAHGKNPATPAALIEWGTYPRQRSLFGTLKTLPALAQKEKFSPPAVAVIGKVVKLGRSLRWFESLPLFGRRILVTRAAEQASELSRRFAELGAEPVELPSLAIREPRSWQKVDRAIRRLGDYDWLIFTSLHGVDFFMQRLRSRGKNFRALAQVRIAAVGPMTARRLEALGLGVDLVPREHTSAALGRLLRKKKIQGQKILFPRAERGREEIVRMLRTAGAGLDVVTVYRSLRPRIAARQISALFARLPDALTFASAATAENFAAMLRRTSYWRSLKEVPAFVIGPVTRKTVRRLGLKVAAMPRSYTLESLIDVICRHFSRC
ncbi:MAG TPA: uroporphyrinogen-III C-methyltransferase [Deltaproteobacteria bacterium]|nr:uroporphyrinogen-III C-methyltransferase [Deltaproteobacteria bacterium]